MVSIQMMGWVETTLTFYIFLLKHPCGLLGSLSIPLCYCVSCFSYFVGIFPSFKSFNNYLSSFKAFLCFFLHYLFFDITFFTFYNEPFFLSICSILHLITAPSLKNVLTPNRSEMSHLSQTRRLVI